MKTSIRYAREKDREKRDSMTETQRNMIQRERESEREMQERVKGRR